MTCPDADVAYFAGIQPGLLERSLEQGLHHFIHGDVFELAFLRPSHRRALRKRYDDVVGVFLENRG